MLAMINKLFGTRYVGYEAGELRKSEFSILSLFLFLLLSTLSLLYEYRY